MAEPIRRAAWVRFASSGVLLMAVTLGCEKDTGPVDPKVAEVQKITAQIQAGDPPVREQCIAALGNIDSPAVAAPLLNIARYDIQMALRVKALRTLKPGLVPDAKPLIHLLAVREDEIRLVTCETLGRLKLPEAEDALANCVLDSASFVRLAAVQALSQYGPGGLARLDKMFQEGTMEERVAIAEVYGKSGDKSRVDVLITALDAREDQLRRAACDSLGKLKDPKAIPALAKLIDKPLSEARLAEYEARFTRKPSSSDVAAMVAILDQEALRSGTRPGSSSHSWINSGDAHKGLFRKVLEKQRIESANIVRTSAINALKEIGTPAALAEVDKLLGSEDEEIGNLMKVVLRSAGPQSYETLCATIEDPRRPSKARLRAAQLLVRDGDEFEDEKSKVNLADAFKAADEGRTLLRPKATRWFERARFWRPTLDDRVTAALIKGLSQEDPAFRAYCARVLAIGKVDGAIEPLVNMLDSGDEALKLAAADAFGQFHDARPVPKLIAILNDKSATAIHKAAIVALGAARDERAVPALLPIATGSAAAQPLQIEAVKALGAIGHNSAAKPLFDYYQKYVNTPGKRPPELEKAIIAAVGQVKSAEAVPVFIKALEESTQAGNARDEYMSALADIGDKSAVPAILARMQSTKYNIHAGTRTNRTAKIGFPALVALGDPRAIPVIEELGRNRPEESIKDAAFNALGEMKCPEAVASLIKCLVDPTLDDGVKDSNVGPALAEQGIAAKAELLKLLVNQPAPKDEFTTDPGMWAAQLLANIGKEALPDLARLAGEKQPTHVMARIITALERIDDDAAVAALGKLLDNPQENIRIWAAASLGKSRMPSAAPYLQRVVEMFKQVNTEDQVGALGLLLKNPDPKIRLVAVQALSTSTRTSAKALLYRAKADPDADVNQAISTALEKMGVKQ